MDLNQDEFEGDYDAEKEEFTDQFTDFYDFAAEIVYQTFEELQPKEYKDGSIGIGMIPPKLFCEDEDVCDSECTFFIHELGEE